ncbi:hypothetical protein [Paracoccus saliphilus]|uniref:Uncharacterized protein n=1 Tax=Paracoccus saliphilus TaxID=405559 RepID=A0AA45W4L6_9RHOB|nr:hypothetical protein [Paracoccus saliphilus]WCR04557.1 hypothetical protein JHX88_07520 [Paracoccus saliphilus]SIS86774.1 hypothetical protein SAMN05421772_10714 [Paracoccus saliphilus]
MKNPLSLVSGGRQRELAQPAGITTPHKPVAKPKAKAQDDKNNDVSPEFVASIVQQALELTAKKLAGDASYKAEVARNRIDAARKPAAALSFNRDFMGNPKPGTFDPINHGGQS